MSDLISRQAAIEKIEEYADRLQMVDWKENPGIAYKAHTLNWCINTIRDLPSAQPETCEGCKHLDQWKDEIEYGYSSPCTCCKRRVSDNYERRRYQQTGGD